MNDEYTYITLRNDGAEVVDKCYRWKLDDLLIQSYETNLLPDGTIEKKAITELKRIAKVIKKLTQESKAKRKDRWLRSLMRNDLSDIRAVMANLRNMIKYYRTEKDTQCKESPEPTSKPCQPSCQIHPDITQI